MNYLPIIMSIANVFYIIYLIKRIKDYKKQNAIRANQSMLEDLSLATSDQLLVELRKRPNFPHMLILPKKHNDYKSLALEIHNLSLVESFKILSLITSSAFNELKEKGINLETEDYGEWHSEGFQEF